MPARIPGARQRLPATVGEMVRFGERLFTRARISYGHGTANARDEAAYLTLHTLKLPLDRLPAARKVAAAKAAQVLALFERRVSERKPAAYLTHEAWLGPHRFFVDERVIVPRSYIAELIHDDTLPYWPAANRVHSVLDLCTGSGCLAVLLAKRYRTAQIDAADISPDALVVADINVRRYRLARRISLCQSDYFSALRNRRYDLIVSNPPYVRGPVMRNLPREYKSEPALALGAGTDGLDALRVILAQSARHLNPEGMLIVECGHARKRVENTWPRLPFFWPETSGGDDCVFVLSREELILNTPTNVKRSPRVKRPDTVR